MTMPGATYSCRDGRHGHTVAEMVGASRRWLAVVRRKGEGRCSADSKEEVGRTAIKTVGMDARWQRR